jgi:hypothetical protein
MGWKNHSAEQHCGWSVFHLEEESTLPAIQALREAVLLPAS